MRAKRNSATVCRIASVVLTCCVVAGATFGDAPSPAEKTLVDSQGYIHRTKAAADLVDQARQCDPLYGPRDKVDRSKAVDLYVKAIAAQPGADVNAALANRVGQMLAFNSDPAKGIRTEPGKAGLWWKRCAELAPPRDLLAGQAHMGVGSAVMMAGRFKDAMAAYREVVAFDPELVEVPTWRTMPGMRGPGSVERLKAIRKSLRDSAIKLRATGVDRLFHAALRAHGLRQALAEMRRIMATYPDAPVADAARKVLQKMAADIEGDALSALPDDIESEKYSPAIEIPGEPCELSEDTGAKIEADAYDDSATSQPSVHPSRARLHVGAVVFGCLVVAVTATLIWQVVRRRARLR